MHHNARLGQSQPDTGIVVVVVERHQQTLERLLGPLQMQHGHAQIVQDLRPLGGANALDGQQLGVGGRLDVGGGALVEGQRVLEEPNGHRVVAHVEMDDAHVVGDHRIVVFAVFPTERYDLLI